MTLVPSDPYNHASSMRNPLYYYVIADVVQKHWYLGGQWFLVSVWNHHQQKIGSHSFQIIPNQPPTRFQTLVKIKNRKK